MVAWVDDIGPDVFVAGPVVILSAVAVAAAVIQITVGANQVAESGDAFGFVVVYAESYIWRAAVGLAAIYAHA